MRLARIITEHADESLELAMQLRSRGFEVETVLPNQIPETPADIEIQLDACNAKDVLDRVMEISADDGSYVFVAPGALDEAVFQRPGDFVANGLRGSFVKSSERGVQEATAASSEPALSHSTSSASQPSRWFEESVAASDELPAPMIAKSVDTNEPQEAAVALNPSPEPAAEGITIREVESPPRLLPSYVAPSNTAPSARPRDAMFWHIAIVAAGLAAVVVVAGSVWQQRRPTPSTLPAPASQRLPFQEPVKAAAPSARTPAAASGVHAPAQDKPPTPTPVPVATPPAQVKPSASAAVPAAVPTPAPVKPSVPPAVPVAKAPAQEKPQAKLAKSHTASGGKPTGKNAQTVPRHHSGDSGLIAEDTVVYYGRKPAAPAQASSGPNTKPPSDIK